MFRPLNIPAGNPHVTIPAGDYDFLGYSARFSTNSRRKIAGNGTLTWGDFYNGARKALVGGVTFKPGYHLVLNLTYDHNQVDLPSGSLTTNLYNDTPDTLNGQVRERAFIVKVTNLFSF